MPVRDFKYLLPFLFLLACSGDDTTGEQPTGSSGSSDAPTCGQAGSLGGGGSTVSGAGGNDTRDAYDGPQPTGSFDASTGGQAGSLGAGGNTVPGADGSGMGGSAGSSGARMDGGGGTAAADAGDSSDAASNKRDATLDAAPLGPITIAAGLKKPSGIALHGDNVYWADETDGTIATCPKTGCGGRSPTLVISAQSLPHGIAFHGSDLYWVTNQGNGSPGSTFRCAITGEASTPTCRASDIVDLHLWIAGPQGTVGIAVSDTLVYVAGGTPNVASCPLSGCGDAGASTLGVASGPKFGVALGAAGVYYTVQFGDVGVCAAAGCASAPTILVKTNFPYALTLDAQRIYWSNYASNGPEADGAIRSCPLAGCTVGTAQVIAAGKIGPYAIAVDDTDLFYTDARNGRVERTPKNDGNHVCAANALATCEACAGYVQCNGTCSASCIDSGAD